MDKNFPPSLTMHGIPAAPGFAVGPAVIFETGKTHVPRSTGHYPGAELERLLDAREKAKAELAELQAKVALTAKSGEADVFQAHRMFIDDISLQKKVENLLKNGLNAEAAWMDAIEAFAVQLEALPDPTLSARSVDLRDVGLRVLNHLLGLSDMGIQLDSPAVVIASDLSPSQTAGLPKEKVLAFCTEKGGPTSHTAILAKALGLPAVVGLGHEILGVEEGSILLVDGTHGLVVANPDDRSMAAFRQTSDQSNLRKREALAVAELPAVTQDGVRVEVAANIGGAADAQLAVAHGADGVGLFRTEFLYLDRNELPGEEEQVSAYRQVFEILGEVPVVVRTLDIGGDKTVSYLGFEQEENPFLGWRAIRMNDGRPDVYLTQVRALLRAGAGRDLRIMVPMVSNIEEVVLAKELMTKAVESLQTDGLECAQKVQFGIMVEVPSTALIADRLAPIVDFFSIGTNDLTQYTLAADRTNARVARLASPYHPGVLRLIQMTIEAAHGQGKWVGVCGELAGEVNAVPLLLGLGLDEFSMAPALTPSIKRAIRKCVQAECIGIANQVLTCSSIGEVIAILTAEVERLNLV